MNYVIDVTHTSHCYANTGIQRVVRMLYQEFCKTTNATGVCFDSYADIWRCLDATEKQLVESFSQMSLSQKRKARWTLQQKVKGLAHRYFNVLKEKEFVSNRSTAFIAPEIFSAEVFKKYLQNFPSIEGPKVAIFHDAIALELPEYTPKKTVARMPCYLDELLSFDGVAAISEASADALVEYWKAQGVKKHPPIVAVPLASEIDLKFKDKVCENASDRPLVLCVGTIEGRKNQITLLRAAELLWKDGFEFDLKLIGIANKETGADTVKCINEFIAQGYSLAWESNVSDKELHAAYSQASFTVYPSLMEGFGLPVLESLQWGVPCVCSGLGALGEVANKGGCLVSDVRSPELLKDALRELLLNKKLHEKLMNEAKNRTYKKWSDYANELKGFIQELDQCNKKALRV